MTKRFLWLAAAATLCAAGCNKDDKKTETKPAEAGGDPAKPAGGGGGGGGATKPAMPAVSLPAGVDRLLAALPIDAEIVVGIDAARLRSSQALGPLFDEAMRMRTSSQMGFDITAECGFDPGQAMGMAVLGMKMVTASEPEITVAVAGIDSAKAVPCFEKARAKIEAKVKKLEVDGNYVHITGDDDGKEAHVAFAFGADNVLVVKAGRAAPDKAAVLKMAAAKAGDGLTGSPEFMGMIGGINTGATIWGLANGGSPMLSRGSLKFQAAFGSIDITDGVNADGRIRLKSADEAQKVAKVLGGQLSSVKQMGFADVAELTPDGSDVKVVFQMKPQTVKNLTAMAKGFLMGRGMGGPGGPGGPGGGVQPAQPPPPEPPKKSGP
jgi:hypothetical protein